MVRLNATDPTPALAATQWMIDHYPADIRPCSRWAQIAAVRQILQRADLALTRR
jgi:hypothetical protein